MAPFSSFGDTHIASFSCTMLQAPRELPTASISPLVELATHVSGADATCTCTEALAMQLAVPANPNQAPAVGYSLHMRDPMRYLVSA